MTIGELSRRTGVTIRALRHYDRIGLLRPVKTTEAGYRIYDEASLERLHTILLFRELEFSLEEIRRIIDTPGFDAYGALDMQIRLLTMRREHIDGLIARARELQEKGMKHMDFKAFDKQQLEDYAAQAKARYGGTEAWRAYEEKEKSRRPGDSGRYGAELMELIGEFGRNRPASADSEEAGAFVRRLQAFITENFYPCTDEILAGLADTYETDAFRKNIDRAGGDGTAAFLAKAIRCKLGQH